MQLLLFRKPAFANRKIYSVAVGIHRKDLIPFLDQPSRYTAKQDIVDYIEMFYDSRRRHSYLGHTSPKGFEKRQLWKKAA